MMMRLPQDLRLQNLKKLRRIPLSRSIKIPLIPLMPLSIKPLRAVIPVWMNQPIQSQDTNGWTVPIVIILALELSASRSMSEDITFKKSPVVKSPLAAPIVITPPPNSIIWKHTLEFTPERSPLDAHNVITLVAIQKTWRPTSWRSILVKNLTPVLIAISLLIQQLFWKYTWGCTLVSNLTNAQNVTTPPQTQVILRYTWESTLEKSHTNANNVKVLLFNPQSWKCT